MGLLWHHLLVRLWPGLHYSLREIFPEPMNIRRVLFVDDDPAVLRLYSLGLSKRGFEIETANEGLAAIKAVKARKPDIMILDLMMPKFSGVDVLKFIRGDKELTELPVIVLSNAYMNDMARDAASAGAQRALLKVRCTPNLLADAIGEVLDRTITNQTAGSSLLAAVPDAAQAPHEQQVAARTETARTEAKPQVGSVATAFVSSKNVSPEDSEVQRKARTDFLARCNEINAELRGLYQSFEQSRNDVERGIRLQNLYRKVHFVTATAGLAECHELAQMASILEALLFDVVPNRAKLSPSVLKTIAETVDFFGVLFARAKDSPPGRITPAPALVVDDDPLNNRLVLAGLRQACFEPQSVEEPKAALKLLKEKRFGLVLLDIEMPDMNGFELCSQLRQVPGYEKVPVIYVTNHSGFENRSLSVESGGNDFITKPVLPLELAVKAVRRLLT